MWFYYSLTGLFIYHTVYNYCCTFTHTKIQLSQILLLFPFIPIVCTRTIVYKLSVHVCTKQATFFPTLICVIISEYCVCSTAATVVFTHSIVYS